MAFNQPHEPVQRKRGRGQIGHATLGRVIADGPWILTYPIIIFALITPLWIVSRSRPGFGRRAAIVTTLTAGAVYLTWRVLFTIPTDNGLNTIVGVSLLVVETIGFGQFLMFYVVQWSPFSGRHVPLGGKPSTTRTRSSTTCSPGRHCPTSRTSSCVPCRGERPGSTPRSTWAATPLPGGQPLEKIGRFAVGVLTQDLAARMLIQATKYRTEFVPEVVAAGLSPESFPDMLKQRDRWCRGNLQVARRWNPLTLPGLTPM